MGMVSKKEWKDFRATGLVFLINSILHVFGWAIVFEVDENTQEVTSCYPARVKFRGFDDQTQDEEHIKIANYLVENSAELKKEAES